MLAASRPDHPARRRPVAALTAPIRTALRGRTCDGYQRHTFQFPQESLNKYELRAEQRRAVRKAAFEAALIAAILAAATLVGYRTLPKAFKNVPATLVQADAMWGT